MIHISVTAVMNPGTFWANLGSDSVHQVEQVQEILNKWPQNFKYQVRHQPKVGVFVAVPSQTHGTYRAQVLINWLFK